MSAHASLHIHRSQGEQVKVEAKVLSLPALPDQNSAYVKLTVGRDTMTLYFDSIEDIDSLAFALDILRREAIEAWDTTREASK